jgi:mannose-6-phosphate isomerase class I
LPPVHPTEAERLLHGDRALVAELGRKLICPRPDNLVERPWGGARIRAFKGLPDADPQAKPIGESFEFAADDGDDEARRHPSIVALTDGSEIALPQLLDRHAETLLGTDFVQRYGRKLPLLPKLLDVVELLSIQAHPPGNTEVYVIVAAEPGASLRLGFARDVDAREFAARLAAGRAEQQRLLAWCAGCISADELQQRLKPWLADRNAPVDTIERELRDRLPPAVATAELRAGLETLRAAYWYALDALNVIPVSAGQVVHNATPPRLVAGGGKPAAAEVHALGNTEGRAVLALEIRRPGPTYRAWDNVRFPLREIDIDAALGALNLNATRAEEFVVEPQRVRAGVRRSVDSEYFRLEHLEPTALQSVAVPPGAAHTLHAIAGAVSVYAADGSCVGRLRAGASALVPRGVGAYRVAADEEPAAVVKVELPPYAD